MFVFPNCQNLRKDENQIHCLDVSTVNSFFFVIANSKILILIRRPKSHRTPYMKQSITKFIKELLNNYCFPLI